MFGRLRGYNMRNDEEVAINIFIYNYEIIKNKLVENGLILY